MGQKSPRGGKPEKYAFTIEDETARLPLGRSAG